jgi:glycosyltransferase involved in cell wall biosynthesis
MVNVGLVTTWHVHCGIATYSEALAEALVQQGVNVYVVRVPRFGKKTPEIFSSIVDKVPVDKVDLWHVQHEYGIWQEFEGVFFPALKRLGKPVVVTMHAVGMWNIDEVIAQHGDRIIVHNKYCASRFPSWTTIIPHGARLVECPPKDECKKKLGIDVRIPVVGYLGFISPYKGLEVLFEATDKVSNAALLIGGGWHVGEETVYMTHLKEKSLKLLPRRCMWLGFVPDDLLSTVYGAMDVFVYPSRFATESGALITALGHGKAVVASDLAPFREKSKSGALITFKDRRDLTRKIKSLLSNKESRERLEEAAKKYVLSTSWEKVAEEHLELYEELLKKS